MQPHVHSAVSKVRFGKFCPGDWYQVKMCAQQKMGVSRCDLLADFKRTQTLNL